MSKFDIDQFCIDDVLHKFAKKANKKNKKKSDAKRELMKTVSTESRIVDKLVKQTFREIQKGQLVINIPV